MRMPPPPPKMCVIDPEVVSRMRQMIRAQTDSEIMETLGIRWGTWIKVREGRPVRVSTAQRLVGKVCSDEGERAMFIRPIETEAAIAERA